MHGPSAYPSGLRNAEPCAPGPANAVLAAVQALAGLKTQGTTQDAPLRATYAQNAGSQLLAARQLNPRRIAVVHAGTRPGPNGIETFLNVARLTPAASQQN